MTEGALKPNGILEEVIFGAAIDGVKDEVEEFRAIVAAREPEMT